VDPEYILNCGAIDALPSISDKIIELGGNANIWTFDGEMGAGKTTLIRVICARLGVQDTVSSPTFSIVNEYVTLDQKKIYHFDFYRIKSEEEAMDMGYEEYFYSGNLCLIEWPSKIISLLPQGLLRIEIISTGADSRKISISKSF
jgi:tRNA threonylcarbamoyladenosine biosynthesis protein TsaE